MGQQRDQSTENYTNRLPCYQLFNINGETSNTVVTLNPQKGHMYTSEGSR